MQGIHRLKGVIKHYDWGGTAFISSLLQQENKDGIPFAEYWMGTHIHGASLIETATGDQSLMSQAGELSFLFKVLDVDDMLSIQVHPAKEAAAMEYARENNEGIPLDSPHRNYKDPNHKPELMVALGDFSLLHGFKQPEELVHTLLNVVELRELLPVFNATGYAGLYRHVMEMPQAEVNRVLQPLLDNMQGIYVEDLSDKMDEDYWAAKAAMRFTHDGQIDRGIFSVYLFNLVHLKKGEGIFQAAGVPHAYLEGQNVEIMASSDNVLRGGLTSKHIDVKELLKHVKCEPTSPVIIKPEAVGEKEKRYPVPVDDFSLSVFELGTGEQAQFTASHNEILLVSKGMVMISGSNDRIESGPGHPSVLVAPGEEVKLETVTEATVFRASGAIHER